MSAQLRVLSAKTPYPTVNLTPPVSTGFVHVAAEVDGRPPVLPPSRAKRRLLQDIKDVCARLERRPDVLTAVAFQALLIPPGRGAFLKKRPSVHVARFDVAILIETRTLQIAEALREDAEFHALEARIRRAARFTHIVTATNGRRIGPVDHNRQGVFLFNYFYADDRDQNLAVWEYTAGWFQHETGLDNSTLLVPSSGVDSQYTVINHCRWDRLRDIIPSLVFKRSFRSYVLKHFEVNNTAAIPILYRLA